MIRVRHPEATDATIELIKKLAAATKHAYGYYRLGPDDSQLPKAEAVPKLEALLPTLPEKMIDQLLDYVTQLKTFVAKEPTWPKLKTAQATANRRAIFSACPRRHFSPRRSRPSIKEDKHERPPGWKMSPRAVLTYICGGKAGKLDDHAQVHRLPAARRNRHLHAGDRPGAAADRRAGHGQDRGCPSTWPRPSTATRPRSCREPPAPPKSRSATPGTTPC